MQASISAGRRSLSSSPHVSFFGLHLAAEANVKQSEKNAGINTQIQRQIQKYRNSETQIQIQIKFHVISWPPKPMSTRVKKLKPLQNPYCRLEENLCKNAPQLKKFKKSQNFKNIPNQQRLSDFDAHKAFSDYSPHPPTQPHFTRKRRTLLTTTPQTEIRTANDISIWYASCFVKQSTT